MEKWTCNSHSNGRDILVLLEIASGHARLPILPMQRVLIILKNFNCCKFHALFSMGVYKPLPMI